MHAGKHWSCCDELHWLSACVLSFQFVVKELELARVPRPLAELTRDMLHIFSKQIC